MVLSEEYARAIHFILHGFGKGIGIDFKSCNLVGVCHSMRSAAMSTLNVIPLCNPSTRVLSQDPDQDNVIHLSHGGAILIEPMFTHPTYFGGALKFLTDGAVKRRDVWSSREKANKVFRERSFKSWDSRVIELHVVCVHTSARCFVLALIGRQKYGLRELPTLTYPDKTEGVTLSCTMVQEAVYYLVGSRSKVG